MHNLSLGWLQAGTGSKTTGKPKVVIACPHYSFRNITCEGDRRTKGKFGAGEF